MRPISPKSYFGEPQNGLQRHVMGGISPYPPRKLNMTSSTTTQMGNPGLTRSVSLDWPFASGSFGHQMQPPVLLKFHAVQELIGRNAEAQSQPGKDSDAEVSFAGLNITKRFPVNIRHLCQAFLGEFGGTSGFSDVGTYRTQYLIIRHRQLWSTLTTCLTPQMYSITP